jgi:hypothetical protein
MDVLSVIGLWLNGSSTPVSEANPMPVRGDFTKNDAASLIKYELKAGYEIRTDDTLDAEFIATALDGAATDALVWGVIKHYKNAGRIVRTRYRTEVAWDERASGWTT